MHTLSLSLLLVLGLFAIAQVRAETTASGALSESSLKDRETTYRQLQDTLIGGHYGAANSICERLAAQVLDSPEALYARISVIYATMTDLEDSSGQTEFDSLVNRCVDRCSDLIRNSENPDPFVYYVRGASLAAQGLWLSHSGAKVQGLKKLMKARGDFERTIRLDSTFYDAYLGRGAYRYAVATHAGLLGWLPFVPNKEDGWEDMWVAVHKSSFSKWSALSSLVWFVIDDGNYDLADSICTAALERFPHSRTFLGSKLSNEKHRKNWPAAYQTARDLEQSFAELGSTNGYELVGLRHALMLICDELGRPDEALTWAQAGSQTPCTPDVARRRSNKFADFEDRLSISK